MNQYLYNVQVLDYGNEVEVKSLPRAINIPGVVLEKKVFKKSKVNDGFVSLCDSFEELGELTAADYERLEMASLFEDSPEVLAQRKKESQRRSLNRSRSVIYSLSRSYKWQYFLTFTFDPSQVDRYDYDAVSSLMQKWLNNMKHQCPDMFYIIVPELHKDGAFHFHGLIAGCSALRLKRHNRKIYNVLSFPYGFSTASRVVSPERASNYISKYITKDLVAVTPGKKRYWHSHNVQAPEPDRLSMPAADREDFIAACYRRARYYKEIITDIGRMIYIHLKKEDFEDVAVFHDIDNYIMDFSPIYSFVV